MLAWKPLPDAPYLLKKSEESTVDKVIKGLQSCVTSIGSCKGHECPYFDHDDEYENGCRIEMERDALKLLIEKAVTG